MPDRCTISELLGRFTNGVKKENAGNDFLDFIANRRIRLNPLLYALEGNTKENPTPEIVQQQYESVYAKLHSALPMAEIIPNATDGVKGVVGVINDTKNGMARKQEFLFKIAPKLKAPVSAGRLPQVWAEVLQIATDCGVPQHSLVVVAALSAAAVPNGTSPAKALLKLSSKNYSAELAYNALADLRSLEVLIHLFALFPHERLLLCTGDKDLSLFWTGIRASNFSYSENEFRFKMSPVEALLPNVPDALLKSYFSE